MTRPAVTRFAPSPSGYLHLGHAYSALRVHDWARAHGATFRLRIEDIDQTRCRPEFETAIVEDLTWLGITWDGPALRQRDRFDQYQGRLDELIRRGLVYRCFRTRREIDDILRAPHHPPGTPYCGAPLAPSDEAQRLADGDPFSWRLSQHAIQSAIFGLTWTEIVEDREIHHPVNIEAFGDIILARKDIPTSYHLASIHDDDATGVTHIIRGDDLRDMAGLHRALYHLFGLTPPTYHHHRLILGEDGRRLAKRDHAATLRSLREANVAPDAIRERLGL